jgi:hypothetical protein
VVPGTVEAAAMVPIRSGLDPAIESDVMDQVRDEETNASRASIANESPTKREAGSR